MECGSLGSRHFNLISPFSEANPVTLHVLFDTEAYRADVGLFFIGVEIDLDAVRYGRASSPLFNEIAIGVELHRLDLPG